MKLMVSVVKQYGFQQINSEIAHVEMIQTRYLNVIMHPIETCAENVIKRNLMIS